MISEEKFCQAIENIRLQLANDKKSSELVAEAFGAQDFALYDNSLLITTIISLLQEYFPKDDNGFCGIEHYCFDLNFGKLADQELITTSDLYYELTKG
jgi:hypothetical protein